ncbi:MAG: hypothetical protein K2X87_06140 [Gemmataceae bacterium]|nr:hypothetical protein [Gemmataceae bacterium]
MSEKNIYHDAVVDALTADGWTITDDPLYLNYGGRKLYVDLAADRAAVAAEKGGERIAVEVQSFVGFSAIENLRHAVGQYVIYRLLLEELREDRALYLAVPEPVYDGLLAERLGQLALTRLGIRVLVFDAAARRVVRWTS